MGLLARPGESVENCASIALPAGKQGGSLLAAKPGIIRNFCVDEGDMSVPAGDRTI
jgi:hypothetical protein